MRRWHAVIAALLLSACGSSPPTHFYTLTHMSANAPVLPVAGPPVKVNAVHIPPTLDRDSIVRVQRGTQVDISSQDRWAASFGDMALRVLTQDLQDRLPHGKVIPADTPAPEHARGLVVDILSFEPDAQGTVTLDADWTLLEGSPANPVLMRHVQLKDGGGASAADEAAAMSRLLEQLADQIASGISGLDRH